MKAKRFILMSVLLLLTFTFYGCKGANKTSIHSAGNFFKELKQYESEVTVTFLKDKQPNEIKMKQIANVDGRYEWTVIEPEHLKDTKVSYDGQQITEYYPSVNKTLEVKGSTAQNEMLLTHFVSRYLTNENIKEQEIQLNGKSVHTYEMPIEGDFKYLSKEKLWLDETSQLPLKMEIYDDTGNVTIEVIYKDFKFNS